MPALLRFRYCFAKAVRRLVAVVRLEFNICLQLLVVVAHRYSEVAADELCVVAPVSSDTGADDGVRSQNCYD